MKLREVKVFVMVLAMGCSKNGADGTPTANPTTTAATTASATTTGTPSASASASASTSTTKTEPIGQATMKKDRSIVLDLFKPAHLQTTYLPSDPKYKEILQHIGPIQPGEQKLVMPWPDDIEDAKVEEVVHAWAAKKKWDKGSYRFEIVGTDKDHNIAVSVVRREDAGAPAAGEGNRIQLILSPKSYAIVKERPF